MSLAGTPLEKYSSQNSEVLNSEYKWMALSDREEMMRREDIYKDALRQQVQYRQQNQQVTMPIDKYYNPNTYQKSPLDEEVQKYGEVVHTVKELEIQIERMRKVVNLYKSSVELLLERVALLEGKGVIS